MNIRTMEPDDLGFCVRAVEAEGWLSETLYTFETFLAHDRGGCLIAEDDCFLLVRPYYMSSYMIVFSFGTPEMTQALENFGVKYPATGMYGERGLTGHKLRQHWRW